MFLRFNHQHTRRPEKCHIRLPVSLHVWAGFIHRNVPFYVQEAKGFFCFVFFPSGMHTGPGPSQTGGLSWFKTITRLKCRLHSVMLDLHMPIQHADLLSKRTDTVPFGWDRASRASLLHWTRPPSSHLLFPKQTQRGPHEHARATPQKHATTRHCMPDTYLGPPLTSSPPTTTSNKGFLLYVSWCSVCVSQ